MAPEIAVVPPITLPVRLDVVGLAVGLGVGEVVGLAVGLGVGEVVGLGVGEVVGLGVGEVVGLGVGEAMGLGERRRPIPDGCRGAGSGPGTGPLAAGPRGGGGIWPLAPPAGLSGTAPSCTVP